MDNKSNNRQVIAGLILLAALLLILGLVLHWLWHILSKQYFVTLLVAAIGVGGSLWTARSTKLKDRELQIEAQQAQNELQIQAQQAAKREDVCRNFMSSLWAVSQDPVQAKNKEFVSEMMKDVMVNGLLWWSDQTVKTFVEFRQLRPEESSRSLIIAARIILSMRADLGHKNDGLTEKDVLDVFLTGTDELFSK